MVPPVNLALGRGPDNLSLARDGNVGGVASIDEGSQRVDFDAFVAGEHGGLVVTDASAEMEFAPGVQPEVDVRAQHNAPRQPLATGYDDGSTSLGGQLVDGLLDVLGGHPLAFHLDDDGAGGEGGTLQLWHEERSLDGGNGVRHGRWAYLLARGRRSGVYGEHGGQDCDEKGNTKFGHNRFVFTAKLVFLPCKIVRKRTFNYDFVRFRQELTIFVGQ